MDDPDHQRLLDEAAAEHRDATAAELHTRRRLYEVIRVVAPHVKQADIVRATGWTREHIRKIVKNGQ